MNQQTGKFIIIAGIILVAVGILVFFYNNAFRWFGRLPGDLRIEGKNTKFYFPIVTMLIVSIVLTNIINVIRRWF